MNKELRELKASIEEKKVQAKALLGEKKVAEAKALMEEIEALNDEFEISNKLFQEEKEGMKKVENKKSKVEVPVEVMAFRNAIMNKPLTEDMKAALVESTDANGGYLVPNVLINEIETLRRQFVSLKQAVQVIPVKSAKGSIPMENEANFQPLVDFDEVSDLANIDMTFSNIVFNIKNKGGIVPMSNTLLSDETVGLPSYVLRTFAKKQIRTENKDILALLAAKTPKQFADIRALKKSFNKDVDPGLKGDGFAFIMNATCFAKFDDEVDGMNRPLLQPNPTQASQKMLFGFPVIVLSDTELANTVSGSTTYAPIYFGNFQSAITYFDREEMSVASSTEAGFTKNQTLLRVIERYDVQNQDTASFVAGQIDVTSFIA